MPPYHCSLISMDFQLIEHATLAMSWVFQLIDQVTSFPSSMCVSTSSCTLKHILNHKIKSNLNHLAKHQNIVTSNLLGHDHTNNELLLMSTIQHVFDFIPLFVSIWCQRNHQTQSWMHGRLQRLLGIQLWLQRNHQIQSPPTHLKSPHVKETTKKLFKACLNGSILTLVLINLGLVSTNC